MDSRFDHLEPNSPKEARLLAGLLQGAQDWGDPSGDLEAGDRLQAAFRIWELVAELEGRILGLRRAEIRRF